MFSAYNPDVFMPNPNKITLFAQSLSSVFIIVTWVASIWVLKLVLKLEDMLIFIGSGLCYVFFTYYSIISTVNDYPADVLQL